MSFIHFILLQLKILNRIRALPAALSVCAGKKTEEEKKQVSSSEEVALSWPFACIIHPGRLFSFRVNFLTDDKKPVFSARQIKPAQFTYTGRSLHSGSGELFI
jgi:hypothetical protein